MPEAVAEFRPSNEAAFDEGLPPNLRELSETHWTPAAVVRLGARWLVEHGAKRVLDVGSGVGKFCTLASLETPLVCVGLEQRGYLVDAARERAARLGATRCQFVVGGLEQLGALPADALYFYNPFAENLAATSIGIDETVELSPKRYLGEVRQVQEHLRRAEVGQLVLTFHGFGGPVPASYQELRSQPAGSDFLQLFRKTASHEPEDGV
ncbi:MAG: class I SAM-dependent methyltransferase [Myxococcaceae bacterium]